MNGSLVVETLHFADGSVAILADLFPSNQAPMVANPLADQTVPEDAMCSFVVRLNTFADADAGDSLTYSAAMKGRESFMVNRLVLLTQIPLIHAVLDSLLRGRRCTRNLLLSLPRKLSVRHRCSVVHAHTDHDEHCIVLLRAALDLRHHAPWCNGKRRLFRVGERA